MQFTTTLQDRTLGYIALPNQLYGNQKSGIWICDHLVSIDIERAAKCSFSSTSMRLKFQVKPFLA